MRNVVLHDITHEQHREENTDNGPHEIEPVDALDAETCRQQMLNLMNNPMQDKGGHSGEETHEETQQQRELPVADMLLAPFLESQEP